MKRLLLSIVMSLTIHGLIFCLNGTVVKTRSYPQLKPHAVTLSLAHRPSAEKMADHQSLPALKKKSGSMLLDEPDKKDSVIERPAKRPEPSDALIQTEIPATSGLTASTSVSDPLQSSAGKGYKEKDPKNVTEKIQQAYDSTAKEMPVPHISQIGKEAVPLYKDNPAPGYPRHAKKRGYQGTVILEVLVTKEGRAGKVNLFQSSRYSVLDDAAVSSVKKWRFEPGEKGDEKIDMWVKIPIRFQIEPEE